MSDELTNLDEEMSQANQALKDLFHQAFYEDLLKHLDQNHSNLSKTSRKAAADIEGQLEESTDAISLRLDKIESRVATGEKQRDEMLERLTRLDELSISQFGATQEVIEVNSKIGFDEAKRVQELLLASEERINDRIAALVPAAQIRYDSLLERLERLEDLLASKLGDIKQANEAKTVEGLEALDRAGAANREFLNASEQRISELIDVRTKRLSKQLVGWVIAGTCSAAASVGWITWALVNHS